MRRVVFDSCSVDPIVDQPAVYEAVRAAVDDKRIEVLFTHITIDELAETPNEDRRSHLLLLLIDLGNLVPTGATVLDYSRLNFCRLDAEDSDALEAFRSGNIEHTRDALVAATAQYEQCALVTHDKRLTNQARARGIEVLTVSDLLIEVGDGAD